jgi:PAS domain S-box-containing protein
VPSLEDQAAWDLAPCGLIELDSAGTIAAANFTFCQWTGYSAAALLNRDWSDLLTTGSNLFYSVQIKPILSLEGSISEVMLDLRRLDGTKVPVLLNATATLSSDLEPRIQMALMLVPHRLAYEETLRAAREEAERNIAIHQILVRRLDMLAEANVALASSLEVDQVLAALATVLVARVADWCIVYTIDSENPSRPPVFAVCHKDPSRQELLWSLAALLPNHSTENSATRKVLAGGEAVLLPLVSDADLRASTTNSEVLDLYSHLDIGSALVVPAMVAGRQVAVFVLARDRAEASFTEEDVADIGDLARRAGVAFENLRMYQRERSASIALQRALLTPPPETDHYAIDVRYAPASSGAEVGGDWYDVLFDDGGDLVLVIGDVSGHDIQAAAAMGQLRGALRSIAHVISGMPSETLRRTDLAAAGLHLNVIATAIVVRLIRLQHSDGLSFLLQWSNAGHPPPIVLTARGQVRVLARPADLLLGVLADASRHDYSVELQPGDTLFLYTDGLVERPGEDISFGIERLAQVIGESASQPPESRADVVLDQSHPDRRDDIALVAVRLLPS